MPGNAGPRWFLDDSAGRLGKRTRPLRPRLGQAAFFAVAFWCSQASAIDRMTVERIRGQIARYAEAQGETLEEFVDRIGSPLWHIESFVYQAEQGGGTAEQALDRLRRFVTALSDPTKRRLLKCIGVRIPRDADPAPSAMDCVALKLRFGVR